MHTHFVNNCFRFLLETKKSPQLFHKILCFFKIKNSHQAYKSNEVTPMTINISTKKYFTEIKYLLIEGICLFFCVMLITNFDVCKKSVIQSLELCSRTLIPSMFPFMFLSAFLIKSGLFNRKIQLFDKITYKIFGLPFCAVIVFLISIVGGFPVGGKTAKGLYEDGIITENQASRLILFCINPSPSFAINAIGYTLFGSSQVGVMIYISVIIANIITAILTRFIDDKKLPSNNNKAVKVSLSEAFVRSGSEASSAMINVCGYVILFSCFVSLIGMVVENQSVLNFIYGLSEVTIACNKLASLNNIPLIAGIVSWAGLGVHFQIMDCIEKTGTDIRLFLASRTVSASVSLIVCDLILKKFPIEVSAVMQASKVTFAPNESSLPVSIAMLITCFLFLIGDYTVNSKIKRYKNIERK